MGNQLWVEPVGELVLARLRGMPTEALFVECQRQVLQILRDQGGGKVLYDALEMEAPPVEVALSQRTLDETLGLAKNPAGPLSFPRANSPILPGWHLGKATTACSTTTSARPLIGSARNRLRDA